MLTAYIDDASSRVSARFYDDEGTIPAMDSFHCYVTRYGIPLTVYTDKHTTYQSPATPTLEEQLAGAEPTSPCGRAGGRADPGPRATGQGPHRAAVSHLPGTGDQGEAAGGGLDH